MKKTASDADVLLKLVREKGLKGAHESEAAGLVPHSGAELQSLAEKLEAEGMLRILSFEPLFFVAPESVEFLGGKIVPHVRSYHEKHPKDKGIPLDKLQKRFDAPAKILLLTLKTLIHEGKLRREGDAFAAPDFVRQLPQRDETMLARIEAIWTEENLRAPAFKDLRERVSLTPQKLQSYLDILVEREKILPTKEGFYLHAPWLQGLVAGIRGRRGKELSVADFKEMTGLSRKLAIPILELLDEMGVTRRRGPTREILQASEIDSH